MSACSVYKSQNPKTFQNTSASCESISEFQYWYETRFPSPHAQLIETRLDTEIWQIQKDSQLAIQTFEVTSGFITRCVTPFSTDQELQKFKDLYFSSLEGETT